MKPHLLLLVLVLCIGCENRGPTEPAETNARQSIKQLLHGTWHTVDPTSSVPYHVFDTTTGLHKEKGDYEGFGFHLERLHVFDLDSTKIVWEQSNAPDYIRYWYLLSGDSLVLSIDSTFTNIRWIYTRFSYKPEFDDWVKPVFYSPSLPGRNFPSETSTIWGFACSDSVLFFLSQNDTSLVNPRVLNLMQYPNGPIIDRISTPLLAIEVESNVLWGVRSYSIEKYSLPSLTPLASFDVSVFLRGTIVTGMAVVDSTILISTITTDFAGKIYRFSKNGQFIKVQPTSPEIHDLAYLNGRLWATNLSNYFYELDPLNLYAIHSYYPTHPSIPSYQLLGRYHGIGFKDGNLVLADELQNYWAVVQLETPAK